MGEWFRDAAEPSWCAKVDQNLRLLRVQPICTPLIGDGTWGLEVVLRQNIGSLDGASLELAHAGLSPRALGPVLCAAEMSGTSWKRLDLAENGLDDSAAEALAGFVARQAAAVEELDLSGNEISALGMARLCAAFAGHVLHAYPQMDDDSNIHAPCRLDLRGNAIDRPMEALKALRGHGINPCLGLKCSRWRCVLAAPVHVIGCLACQTQALPWGHAELLEVVGAPLAPRHSARRQPALRKSIPLAPREPRGLRPALGQLPPALSPVHSREAVQPAPGGLPAPMPLGASATAASVVPRLEALQLSPLSLASLGAPRLTVGQLVQARPQFTTAASTPGVVAGEILKVVSAPALVLYAWGRVQVTTAAAEGSDNQAPAWVDINGVVTEPALQ